MTDLKLFPSRDDALYYILYDLREDPSLSKIHLPKEGEGPILLRVNEDQYISLAQELRELCANEGNEWATSMLIRPSFGPTNYTDLEENVPYIVIVHVQDFEDFVNRLPKLKRQLLH